MKQNLVSVSQSFSRFWISQSSFNYLRDIFSEFRSKLVNIVGQFKKFVFSVVWLHIRYNNEISSRIQYTTVCTFDFIYKWHSHIFCFVLLSIHKWKSTIKIIYWLLSKDTKTKNENSFNVSKLLITLFQNKKKIKSL